MSLLGRWRIIKMPDHVEDFPDIVEPAYILFKAHGSGNSALSTAGDEADFIARRWTFPTAC
jgi:hypothetical protein